MGGLKLRSELLIFTGKVPRSQHCRQNGALLTRKLEIRNVILFYFFLFYFYFFLLLTCGGRWISWGSRLSPVCGRHWQHVLVAGDRKKINCIQLREKSIKKDMSRCITQIHGCLRASAAVMRLAGLTVNIWLMRFLASGVTVSHSGDGYYDDNSRQRKKRAACVISK